MLICDPHFRKHDSSSCHEDESTTPGENFLFFLLDGVVHVGIGQMGQLAQSPGNVSSLCAACVPLERCANVARRRLGCLASAVSAALGRLCVLSSQQFGPALSLPQLSLLMVSTRYLS